jgi:enoyl-CoA hydratase
VAEATVLVDRPREGVGRLTLNRPERLNALTEALLGELQAGFEQLDADPACRVIVVTGAGRAFCAGLDLGQGFELPDVAEHGPAVGGMDFQERVAAAMTHPARLGTPVVAAVNGPAVGGGLALALACDVRIASASALFGAAFVRIGLSGCDCGVSWTLPRAVGSSHAFELMLTGREVAADEAERIGLVSRTVGDEELEEAAYAVAAGIAANSPFGVRMTKQVMWESLAAPSLDAAVALENRTQILCTITEDGREAVAAFTEKRPPRYRNR